MVGHREQSRAPEWNDLVQLADGPGVRAMALVGSHARGDAGPFSDVDLVRLVDPAMAPGLRSDLAAGSHLLDGRLVTVSDATPGQVERWFTRPEESVEVIAGLRAGRALRDVHGDFAALVTRARAFVWTPAHQRRANRWASRAMAGWAEEAQKGLEGLRRDDAGRLLLARHGCTWGLVRVVQVQRGVLATGDNLTVADVVAAVGPASLWAVLCRRAFGLAPDTAGRWPALRDQVTAGLYLYVHTTELLAAAWSRGEAAIIRHTAQRITSELGPPPASPSSTGATPSDRTGGWPQ